LMEVVDEGVQEQKLLSMSKSCFWRVATQLPTSDLRRRSFYGGRSSYVSVLEP
jgi:hypothetical protein